MQTEGSNLSPPTAVDDNNIKETLYRVKITHSNETAVFRFPSNNSIEGRKIVIVPTKYGVDHGVVLGPVYNCHHSEMNNLQDIIRIATEEDQKKIEANAVKEKQALRTCREKVDSHGLDMQLVSAHYLVEEPKVLFFFTAEQRVDFRALVKDLVSEFKMRIELRQIGVRDESRVLGGLGVCGRYLCCNKVTDKLKPVSIKMAKEQNLSLNSMKISGPCGRLLCCLSYEYDFYCEEKRRYPSEGTRLPVGKETYKVTEVNILSKSVKLLGSDGHIIDVPSKNFLFDESSKRWKVDVKDLISS